MQLLEPLAEMLLGRLNCRQDLTVVLFDRSLKYLMQLMLISKLLCLFLLHIPLQSNIGIKPSNQCAHRIINYLCDVIPLLGIDFEYRSLILPYGSIRAPMRLITQRLLLLSWFHLCQRRPRALHLFCR